jgi:hypothetical protein
MWITSACGPRPGDEDQNAINAEIGEIHLDWNGEFVGAAGGHWMAKNDR